MKTITEILFASAIVSVVGISVLGFSATAFAYPLDGYEETGIRRERDPRKIDFQKLGIGFAVDVAVKHTVDVIENILRCGCLTVN